MTIIPDVEMLHSPNPLTPNSFISLISQISHLLAFCVEPLSLELITLDLAGTTQLLHPLLACVLHR